MKSAVRGQTTSAHDLRLSADDKFVTSSQLNDICIRKCQEAVNALRGCLDKRDGQSHRMALTQGTTGVDCMPTIASWKDCCEKAKFNELKEQSARADELLTKKLALGTR